MKTSFNYSDKIKEKLHTMLYSNINDTISDNEFTDILDETIAETLAKIEKEENSADKLLKKIRRSWRGAKIRWAKEDRESNDKSSPYFYELNIRAKNIYNAENGRQFFFDTYGVSSIDELKHKLDESIDNWRASRSNAITSYLYTNQKTKQKILFALKRDIEYHTLLEYQKYSKLIQKSKNKVDLISALTGENKQIDDCFKESINEIYKTKDNYSAKIDTLNVEKDSLINFVQEGYLNQTDIKVLAFIIKQLEKQKLLSKKIFEPMDNIIKSFSLTPTACNYTDVSDSLFKLAYLSVNAEIINGHNLNFRLIDNIDINLIDNKKYVNIIVSKGFIDQLIKKNTEYIYGDILSKFKSKITLSLVYLLQIIRFELLPKASHKNTASISYGILQREINFNSTDNEVHNLKLIENAFDEIIKNDIILSKYTRVNNDFHLEFLLLSDYEKDNIGKKNTKLNLP